MLLYYFKVVDFEWIGLDPCVTCDGRSGHLVA